MIRRTANATVVVNLSKSLFDLGRNSKASGLIGSTKQPLQSIRPDLIMRKAVYLFLAIVIIAGIFVYSYKTGTPTETRRPPPRKSKAFQSLETVGGQSVNSSGADTKAAADVKGDAKLLAINQMREIGYEFIRKQRDYVRSIEDTAARNEADTVFILGNQLMLAAVLTEMSKSMDYSEQLINMLQDEGLRWYIEHMLSGYFPVLSKHIKEGGRIDANNLAAFFSDERDFVSEFDNRVASKLSADDAAAFETGIANYVAANVLTWEAISSGELDRLRALPLFWEASYRELGSK